MTKGYNNVVSSRKMKRFIERQKHKKNDGIDLKDLKYHKEHKELNDKSSDEIDEIDEIDKIKEFDINLSPDEITKYTFAVCMVQFMMMIVVMFSSYYVLSFLFGLLISLIEIIKFFLLKNYNFYNESAKTPMQITDQTDQTNQTNKTKDVAEKIILFDTITSTCCVLGSTCWVMNSTFEFMTLITSMLYLLMSGYKLYFFNKQCYVKNRYIKDLSPTVVSLIFYTIAYFDVNIILFLMIMINIYKDVGIDLLNYIIS